MRRDHTRWLGGRTSRSASAPAVLAGALFGAGLLAGRRDRQFLATRAELKSARRDAEAAGERAQLREQMGDTVRGLLSSGRTREDVCRAALELAGAHAAIIYEPRASGWLTYTAMAGIDFGDGEVVLESTSRARRAFDVARPVFLAGAREDRVSSVALWRAAGRPASVLYQPMVWSGRTLGVLAAGWREVVPFDGPQCAAVALLAHEAAALIAHADAVDALTGQTRTDALTGLPNRRGFDAQLAAALELPGPLAVVTLDLDGFADYNEAFGHPAGDRLLKAAIAGWQRALRPADVLARIDGGAFGLVLPGGEAAVAVAVAERLRMLLPDDQTCSAGVAVRRADEPAESLLRRADHALLAAKAGGRDGVRLSDAVD